MLGQLVKVLILNGDKVLNGNKTVFNNCRTCGKIDPNTRERIAESGCGCVGCHLGRSKVLSKKYEHLKREMASYQLKTFKKASKRMAST